MKDLCLGIQYFAIKLDCFIRVYSLNILLTVLLEYINYFLGQTLPIYIKIFAKVYALVKNNLVTVLLEYIDLR